MREINEEVYQLKALWVRVQFIDIRKTGSASTTSLGRLCLFEGLKFEKKFSVGWIDVGLLTNVLFSEWVVVNFMKSEERD